MADTAAPNPLPAGGGGGDQIPPPNPQITASPSMDLPQISSPQINQPLQSQSLMAPSSHFQVQPNNLQRSGSMPRIAQMQQQLGVSLTAGAMRQHTGIYGSQMSFGGGGQPIPQGRAGIIGQGGQLPMLPGQSAGQFNLQSHMLTGPRPKIGIVQRAQQLQQANASGQGLQGLQSLGMMGGLGMNPQIRGNGPLSYGQQRFTPGQMQALSQQAQLTSQKLPVQNQTLQRASSITSMNPQLSGLTQNGQATLMQSNLTSQQWLKQIQPPVASPVSPSYHLQQQRQQQTFLPQHISSQLHQKSMGLSHQQISQLVQHQTHQQQHLFQPHQQQQQQLSPRLPGPTVQKSISLTGSQPDTPASGVTNGGSSSHGTEVSNQLLGKRKIQDLVAQVDSHGKVDPEVVDLLLEIADDFIDSVTSFACRLAKHRKSSTLESKDVLLHLEKNWHLTIPGYTREENKHQRTSLLSDVHNKRLESVRSLTQQSEREASGAKGSGKQTLTDSAANRSINPSASSEQQFVHSAAAPQMLHKVTRF